jgi:hypothetical protein
MAERKAPEKDADREQQERKERAEREQRERTDQERAARERQREEKGTLTPTVGALGATPKLSSDPHLATTPVTVTGEQAGGTILLDTGHVAYSNEGAVSATPGGPIDPTIIPGQFEEEAPPEGGARMIDRSSAPGGAR